MSRVQSEVLLETLTIPKLPAGWHLDGLWHDGFATEPDKQYEADASFFVSGDKPGLQHIEASSYGPTFQAALWGLPAACSEVIRTITESKEWIDAESAR